MFLNIKTIIPIPVRPSIKFISAGTPIKNIRLTICIHYWFYCTRQSFFAKSTIKAGYQ